MDDERQSNVSLLLDFGFPEAQAMLLAEDRTPAQIREWIKRSAGKENPHGYFLVLHRANEPVADKSRAKAAAAKIEDPDGAFKRERNESMLATLAEVEAGQWDSAEDNFEVRFDLLKRFGYYELNHEHGVISSWAEEMAAYLTLPQILTILREAAPEPFPRAYARRELEWRAFYNRRENRPAQIAVSTASQPPPVKLPDSWRATVAKELEAVRARAEERKAEMRARAKAERDAEVDLIFNDPFDDEEIVA